MIRSALSGAAFLFLAACATAPAALTPQQQSAEAATITAMLKAQDAAWNTGDIDGFMHGYWPSEALRFASGGDVVHGFDSTLARYKRRYPDRAAMGELTTSDYEIEILSADAAIAHGRWKVTTATGSSAGLYTLVLRNIGGDWLIVSDTTTSAD
ncbi:MAG: nuclear transport factor 2 family protein [Hyphomonas sp.]